MKLFKYVLLFIIFYSVGFLSYHYKLPPYKLIKAAKNSVGENNKSNPGEQYIKEKTTFFQTFMPEGEIAFVGDSITDGAEWYQMFKNQSIVNLGIGWNTITNINHNRDLITNTNVKYVFIMGGVNDFNVMHYNPKNVLNSYIDLIDYLSRNEITVFVQSTIQTRRGTELNNQISSLNSSLTNYCADSKLCTFIDINKNMSTNGELNELYTYDGIHLNGHGYKAWYDSILSVINSLASSSLNTVTDRTPSNQ